MIIHSPRYPIRRLRARTRPGAGALLVAARAGADPGRGRRRLAGEAAQVKKLLEQKFPGATVGSVTKSPYFGLYEVLFDDQLVYTDAKVDVRARRHRLRRRDQEEPDRGEAAQAQPRRVRQPAARPRDQEGQGQRRAQARVFSDADCPFCARLENELKGIDNVTIYTFLYPIDQLHPDAASKSRMIWCAPDRVKAWDAFFESGALPNNNGRLRQSRGRHRPSSAQKMRVTATPTLVFADGTSFRARCRRSGSRPKSSRAKPRPRGSPRRRSDATRAAALTHRRSHSRWRSSTS